MPNEAYVHLLEAAITIAFLCDLMDYLKWKMGQ